MNTKLLPHNDKAYAKVVGALKDSQRTCVIHPTGTGKSYLMAAVSEEYKKVLILGPNVYVLNQVHNVLKWRKKGIKYMTYAALMHSDTKPTGYDLICLDEFHRVGAPEWGGAVEELLEVNPQAKIFGTTATNIRYLDEERDMAQEIFDGNVASRISIAEAWSDGILPIPRYVSGLFRWDKTVDDAKERISNSRRIDSEEKRKRLFRLSNACLHWNLSYGMPAILRKHLDKDTRRVIIFCSYIEMLEQMRRQTEVWFREAGFNVTGSYFMHSNMNEREQREQMSLFESDSNGVKLMFSINMLNEGIHIPDVGAVIMLRTTSSRIIYLQQMGRCLTAANTAKPLVLDMVDNITTTTVVDKIATEFDKIEAEKAEMENRKPRTFQVIDYTLGVKDLISKLVPEELSLISDEERLEIVTAFCEEHGRFPSRFKKDEEKVHRHYVTLRKHLKGDPRLEALDEKYSEYKDFDKRLARLVEFVEKNCRVPNNDDKAEYLNYKVLCRKNREMGINNPVLVKILKDYAVVHNNEYVKQAILDFYAKHGRMPKKNSTDREERRLYNKYVHRRGDFKNDEDIQRIVQKRTTLEEKIKMMQEYVAKYHRRPRKSEQKNYAIWNNMLQQGYDNPEVQRLLDETDFSPKRMKNYIAPLVEFVDREHRAPKVTKGTDEKHLYNIMAHIRDTYSDNPMVVELLKKIDDFTKQQEEDYIKESVAKVDAFVSQNGFLPSGADPVNRNVRDLFNYLRRTRGNHPLVAAMVEKYTNKL